MQMTQLRLLVIAFLFAVAPSAFTKQGIQASEVLLRAKAIITADQESDYIKTALSPSSASEFAARMEDLHRAATDKNHHQVARSAVEVFRLLVDNLQTEGLEIPKEVSLLDYAGFKLQVLAASRSPDWEDIRKTVSEADAWWTAIKSKVSEQGLRDAFGSAIRGLDEAAKVENLPMLRFAAQIDLDLVDLLENDLKAKR
jgi:hypothetical protein